MNARSPITCPVKLSYIHSAALMTRRTQDVPRTNQGWREVGCVELSLDPPHPSSSSSLWRPCAAQPRALPIRRAPSTPGSWRSLCGKGQSLASRCITLARWCMCIPCLRSYLRDWARDVISTSSLWRRRGDEEADEQMCKHMHPVPFQYTPGAKANEKHVHDFVIVVGEERDCRSLLASTTRTTCTVQNRRMSRHPPGRSTLHVPIRCTYASIVFAIW